MNDGMHVRANRHIRYAVVGLGHIAQVAVLPAFAHAARNSQLTALVSGDATKRRTVSKKYGVKLVFGYDEYEECLDDVDAVYIALPNSMHAEYAIRAAEAGVHVLCEKPMAVTARECERMLAACSKAGVRLMIAYRLHFDTLTLEVIDLVRRGRIGDPRFFDSAFSLRVRPGNIRTKKALGGGPLHDLGIYCINAARNLFGAEPVEVSAQTVHSGATTLREIDETVSATMRFDKGRVASFVTSFNAADVGAYRIAGTRGDIRVDPGFEYAEGLAYELTVEGRTTRRRTRQHDQFAAELLYFSECILAGRDPEPSGLEGLHDVRIIEAIQASMRRGKAVRLPRSTPMVNDPRPTRRQRITRPAVKEPALVHAQSGSRD